MDVSDYFPLLFSRKITCIVDSPIVEKEFQDRGFEDIVHFDDFDFCRSTPAFMVINHMETHNKLKELWDTSQALISHLAAAKFDTSPESLKYSLDMLLAADVPSAIRTRSKWYDYFSGNRRFTVRSGSPTGGSGNELTCHLNTSIEIANNDLKLSSGWFYSIAEWFESSLVNIQADKSSFSLEGSFSFDGMIYLCNSTELKEKYAQTFNHLVQQAAKGQNKILFANNQIQQIVINGEDLTQLFQDLSRDEIRGLSATEFAMGCVDHVHPIDWSVNSLLNESTLGTHVGIGMGRHFPHVDFISQHATIP